MNTKAKVIFVLLTSSLLVASLLGSSVLAQSQSRDQQACINAINKSASKVTRTQYKETSFCLKLAGKGLLGTQTAQECVEGDTSGKVGVASAKTLAAELKRCTETPDFGYSSGVNANQSSVEEAVDAVGDVFGTPLENSIVTAAGTRCQDKLVGAVSKVDSTMQKIFQRCAKDGLKGNINAASGLEACIDQIAVDAKGKVSKAKAKVLKVLNGKCFGAEPALDLTTIFGGDCVADAGSSDDLNACISNLVDCRVCRSINLVTDIQRDCDEFDDQVLNESCASTLPTCDDLKQNQDESDVDCGGSVCPACGDGLGCQGASDCTSGVCIGNVCQAPTCVDATANGDETDVDCGGAICNACPDGSNCLTGSDCTSLICTGNMCVPPNCMDLVQNGDETGIDCGGSCPGCPAGQGCDSGDDCLSEVCTGNVCQAPSCSDGIQNGDEGDVDCGGSSCAACPDGSTCNVASDCNSGVCSGGICLGPTCSDGVQNQDETDIDCGGSVCGVCQIGEGCSVGTDCTTGSCNGGTCACPGMLWQFNINSSSGGVFTGAQWPGGTQSQNGPAGCSVSINNPSGRIDLVGLLGDDFEVTSFSGYSNCFGTGGEDGDGCETTSCPFAGIAFCEARRPSCSVALNGSGSARFYVQCNP